MPRQRNIQNGPNGFECLTYENLPPPTLKQRDILTERIRALYERVNQSEHAAYHARLLQWVDRAP